MAEMAAMMMLAGTAVSAGGSILGGKASMLEGRSAGQAADYEAMQLRRAAKEERAIGQRKAMERNHETDILMSEQVARAASSGAGVVNPTILNLISETAGRGAYLADSEMTAAETAARSKLDQAKASVFRGKLARMRGKSAMGASLLDAGATVLGGLSKIKYG